VKKRKEKGYLVPGKVSLGENVYQKAILSNSIKMYSVLKTEFTSRRGVYRKRKLFSRTMKGCPPGVGAPARTERKERNRFIKKKKREGKEQV